MWVSKLLRSFRYALEGLKYTLVSQRNMRVHFLLALVALLLGLYLPIEKNDMLLLFLTIILVLVAELFNTAIEAVVDLVTKDFHPLAKVAKDVAAGAVLLCAGFSVVVGVNIFYPYLDVLLLKVDMTAVGPTDVGLTAIVGVNFILTLLLKSWFHRQNRSNLEPSLITSLAFCITTLSGIMIGNLLIAFFLFLLAALLTGMQLSITKNGTSVFVGAALGIIVALVGIQLL